MELHSETFNPADFAWRGLTLTPAAAAHIHELVAKKPEILGVRLGVKQTGCAGFGYVLDTVTEPEKDDLVFETDARNCTSRCRPCRLSTAPKWTTSAKA
jgi:Fe-S cluster assembly protein SufA